MTGVRTVIFCISARRDISPRSTHLPTGAAICVLPVPPSYLKLRRYFRKPYGWSFEEMFGEVHRVRRPFYRMIRDVAPYLTTPLRSLAGELRATRCQAILSQEYESSRFDVCLLLGKLLKIPVFATFQGGNWHRSRIERWSRPWTLRTCAGLIIGTRLEMERVEKSYRVPGNKIARIFNPIDLRLWNSGDRCRVRAELGLQAAAQVVIWHGRVDVRRKGLDILLETWKKVREDRPGRDLRLLLVGTGEGAAELRERIKQLGLENIHWIDKYVLDRRAIRDYLSAADAYVLPSRHEGFPVAPIEAMACGLPVVATDAPGVSDIFEGGELAGGLVVKCEDAAALSSALGRVLDDRALAERLGKCGKRRVENSFSLASVGKQLRAFLIDRAEKRHQE